MCAETTVRIVTRQQGSWRWQKRYGLVEYVKNERGVWKSQGAVRKDFARTKATEHLFATYEEGSLHNKRCP